MYKIRLGLPRRSAFISPCSLALIRKKTVSYKAISNFAYIITYIEEKVNTIPYFYMTNFGFFCTAFFLF